MQSSMSLTYYFAIALFITVSSSQGRKCKIYEFQCRDGIECIYIHHFCDGLEGCSDGSDEPQYASQDDHNATLCRGRGKYQGALCHLPRDLEYDRKRLCRYGLYCLEDEFECRDRSRCLAPSQFCDGYKDCRDASDEPMYATNDDNNIALCRGTSTSHASLCVLPSYLEHDRKRLCRYDITCSEEEFACHDGSSCLSTSYFCDGETHCSDGSDEPYATYDDNGTLCRMETDQRRLCILPPELHHKIYSMCSDNITCPEGYFECLDGSRCFFHTYFCDGQTHCSDGSDERRSSPAMDSRYRKCFGVHSENYGVGPCQLSKEYFCDGKKQLCAEGMDECLCGEKDRDHLDNVCFRCLKTYQSYIPISKLCDGQFDCPDLTDECLCQSIERPKICERLGWVGNIAEGQEPYLQCNESNNSRRIDLDDGQVCDMNSDCNFIENEEHCGQLGYSRKVCITWNGEPGKVFCSFQPKINSFAACFGENFHCKVLLEKYPLAQRMPNLSRQWITCSLSTSIHQVCDVVFNCMNDGSFTETMTNKNCESRDGNVCNCSYFYCNDGVDAKYIHPNAICNGFKDCISGVDECQPGCIDSAFSDEKSMITSKGVLTLVWIFSIFALIGCTSVVASTLHDLVKNNCCATTSSHSRINKLLILSLSVSDLLVGVYTISICIKATEVEGRYCTADVEWRTSTACSVLGAILIIGSEQSVLTMVLITIYRLHAVVRPLSRPKAKRAILAIALSWMISILFGLIPLMPSYEDYFVRYVSFNDTLIFKTQVNQVDKSRIINWLGLMDNGTIKYHSGSSTEWRQLKELISRINPSSPIKATNEFGYYSTHSVCLPTLFPDQKDESWMYSFGLLFINFMAFVFMLVCYIALYRKANNKKVLESAEASKTRSKQNVRMQRKLTRILASDFLCWMPVCIMGFLQVAGIDIPNDAYLPTGLLIIPINSALNPFLYSDLPDVLSTQKSKLVSWTHTSLRRLRSSDREAETAVSQTEAMEMNMNMTEMNRLDIVEMNQAGK